jgi:DNA polymerase-3 subunit alpha
MAFVAFEDQHGVVELTVFSRLYAKTAALLVEDACLLVQGELQKEEGTLKIVAESVMPIEKAEEIWAATVHFHIDLRRAQKETLEALRAVLEGHPGSCPAFLHLKNAQQVETIIELPEALRIKAGPQLAQAVGPLFGSRAVETRCLPVTNPKDSPRLRRNGYSR